MRSLLVSMVLLAALGAPDAQHTSTPTSAAQPIEVPRSVQGAMQYTPQQLSDLVLPVLTSAQKKQVTAVVTSLKQQRLQEAQEMWAAFLADLLRQVSAGGANDQLLATLHQPGFTTHEEKTDGDTAADEVFLMAAAFKLEPGTLSEGSTLDPFVQHVIAQTYVASNADLAQYVAEVSQQAEEIRELIRHGHEIQAQLDPDDLAASWQEVQAAEADFLDSLGTPGQVPPEGAQTPEELDAYIEEWDEELQTVGEDAQLANIDLQNQLQKQQQTLQMMSQISKVLHDTAMAVIRKMSG